MANHAPTAYRRQAGWALKATFTPAETNAILDAAERRYTPPPGARTAGGRLNLQMASYLVALRDALIESGLSANYANGVLVDALFRVTRRLYRPTDLVALALHPLDRTARERWRQRLARRLYLRRPDWLMVEFPGSGCYAFDVKRCLLADYMNERGESEFCRQVICSQELMMARARDQTLIRTETIAGGSARCKLRFIDLIAKPLPWKPER